MAGFLVYIVGWSILENYLEDWMVRDTVIYKASYEGRPRMIIDTRKVPAGATIKSETLEIDNKG